MMAYMVTHEKTTSEGKLSPALRADMIAGRYVWNGVKMRV